MYGFGGTPQGNATLKTVMAGVLDAMHEVAPDAPGVLTWASAGSSASTSATAAPRSPSSRCEGEVRRTAMRPV